MNQMEAVVGADNVVVGRAEAQDDPSRNTQYESDHAIHNQPISLTAGGREFAPDRQATSTANFRGGRLQAGRPQSNAETIAFSALIPGQAPLGQCPVPAVDY
jgi:hypothetical protein